MHNCGDTMWYAISDALDFGIVYGSFQGRSYMKIVYIYFAYIHIDLFPKLHQACFIMIHGGVG